MESPDKFINPEPITPIDHAKRRFDTAAEVVFGIENRPDEDGNVDFTGLTNFDVNRGDLIEKRNATLALYELFRAGAELEAEEKLDRLNHLPEYSDEALKIQKPGPKEVAYDYILGRRKSAESQKAATEVFREYIGTAQAKRDEFVLGTRRQEVYHNKTRKRTEAEHEEQIMLEAKTNKQIDDVIDFAEQNYKLKIHHKDEYFRQPKPQQTHLQGVTSQPAY